MRSGLTEFDGEGEEGHAVLVGDVGDAGFWGSLRKDVSLIFISTGFLKGERGCARETAMADENRRK